MRRAWLAVLLAVGCGTSGGGDDEFPIDPGGGGGGGTHRDAAAVVDAPLDDGALAIVGRVCLTSDLRALASCASTGAENLTVTLGGETTTTQADGTFTIARPVAADVWRVSGGGVVPSVMPATLGSPVIPVIASADYADLIAANFVTLVAGQGAVVARVVRAGTPVSDATATSSPLAVNPTFYDGASAATWETTATGANGVAWLPGIAAGATTISVTPQGGTATSVTAAVEDLAITYLTVAVP